MTKNNNTEELIKRVKFLVLPYLLVLLIGLAGLGLLRFTVDLFLGYEFNVSIWRFWLPGIGAFVLWLLFMRDRISTLKIPNKNDNGYFNSHIAVGLAIAIPICLSQFFLEKSLIELKEIDSVYEIDPANKLQNYKISTIEWNDQCMHSTATAETSGRNNEHLNYYCYVIAPMFSTGDSMIWIGKRYKRSLDSRDSESFKQREWVDLQKVSLEDYKDDMREEGLYLNRIPVSEDGKAYTVAIHRNPVFKDKRHVIYELSDTASSASVNLLLIWIMIVMGVGLVLLTVFAIYFPPDAAKLKKYRKGLDISSVDDIEVRNFLMFKTSAKGSAFILYVNVFMMMYMIAINMSAFSPQASELLQLGGLRDAEVTGGEYWRLITYQFLHSGIIHLISNLVLITLFGAMIETHMKTWKYVAMYLFTGVIAGLGSIYFNEYTVAVGASGALFGIFGWFVTVSLTRKNMMGMGTFLPLILIMIVVNLIMGFVIPNVDNAGHIFGLVGGILAGFIFIPRKAG